VKRRELLSGLAAAALASGCVSQAPGKVQTSQAHYGSPVALPSPTAGDGLIVIGVHTPEFSFEQDSERVWQATTDRRTRGCRTGGSTIPSRSTSVLALNAAGRNRRSN